MTQMSSLTLEIPPDFLNCIKLMYTKKVNTDKNILIFKLNVIN